MSRRDRIKFTPQDVTVIWSSTSFFWIEHHWHVIIMILDSHQRNLIVNNYHDVLVSLATSRHSSASRPYPPTITRQLERQICFENSSESTTPPQLLWTRTSTSTMPMPSTLILLHRPRHSIFFQSPTHGFENQLSVSTLRLAYG